MFLSRLNFSLHAASAITFFNTLTRNITSFYFYWVMQISFIKFLCEYYFFGTISIWPDTYFSVPKFLQNFTKKKVKPLFFSTPETRFQAKN